MVTELHHYDLLGFCLFFFPILNSNSKGPTLSHACEVVSTCVTEPNRAASLTSGHS